MRSLGIVDKIVGLGSRNLKEIDNYTFETITGENYSYIQGMNPVTYLEPWMKNLPAVAEYGEAVNYETIASLNPDVVIIRIGFCSMNTDEYGTNEDITRAIDAIEALGFPVVILKGPPAFSQPTIQNISQEIRIIGQIFGKENEATTLISYLEGIINMIKGRTMNITETEKPTVLLFGLSPNARETGGVGDVLCRDTIESHLIEDIINEKNAINEQGGWKIMSTEQILAVNPDVIVLPTDWGYHPPKELYTASYYQNLQELEAVKNHRVWALPWTPYNCAKRLEYPIEVMVTAKAAYPQLFNDIKIHDWVLDFYKTVYHVDNETAISLRSIQWLDWTVEEDV
jgi:iron complex transport system substrate-binding protein